MNLDVIKSLVMLDLQELEKRLDEALSKETQESLSSWLLSQRQDNLKSYLGNGCMESLKSNPTSFNQELPQKDVYYCNNKNDYPSNSLLKAA
jgi:hypothetical protein